MLWRAERLARGHIAHKYKSQDLIVCSSAASCWVSGVSIAWRRKDYVCPQRKRLWRLGEAPIFQLSRFLRISLGRDLYGPWGPRGRSSREVATKDPTQNTKRDTAQYWRWLGTVSLSKKSCFWEACTLALLTPIQIQQGSWRGCGISMNFWNTFDWSPHACSSSENQVLERLTRLHMTQYFLAI